MWHFASSPVSHLPAVEKGCAPLLWYDGPQFESRPKQEMFSSLKPLGQRWDEPSLQRVPVFFPGWVKRPRRYVNNSPPCIAEVKNEWSYTSLGVDRDTFTFTAALKGYETFVYVRVGCECYWCVFLQSALAFVS